MQVYLALMLSPSLKALDESLRDELVSDMSILTYEKFRVSEQNYSKTGTTFAW